MNTNQNKNTEVAQDLLHFRNEHEDDHQVIVSCAIRNLKNQNKFSSLNAQQITESLGRALNQSFTGEDKVEIIKIEFPELEVESILECDPEYNNIHECQFLKEVLSAECLTGFENTSPELDQTFRLDGNDEEDESFEQKVLTKEEQVKRFLEYLQQLYFSGNIYPNERILKEIQRLFYQDKPLNKGEDTVLNALLKFKLKLLNVLPNFQFTINNQSLFLNFKAAKLLNENSQITKEYNVKMGKKMVSLKTFEFGCLFEKYEAEKETLHDKGSQQDIKYEFSSYFDYQHLASKFNHDISQVMYYHREESNFSKYLEVVISFYNKLLLKIQIEFTYCQFAILQQQGNESILYLKMISPPLFQVSIYKNRRYEIYNLKKDWMRVHNIFLDLGVQQKTIAELQRLMLINNTTIKLVFDTNQQNQEQKVTFSGLIEKLNQFQLMHHDIDQLKIKITSVNKDYQQNYEEVQTAMKSLPFSCQFNLCSVISTNRLFLPNPLMILVKKLLKERQTSQKNFEQIQEVTFQQFYKLSDNANIYFHIKKFHNHNLLLFNKILKNAQEEIVEGEINLQLAYIFRLSLTPSGFMFQFKMPEETSKVIRDRYDLIQYFIRLHFQDENQEGLHGISFISKNYFWHLLETGVQIFNRRYSLLTWSASQLRSGSCWLFDSQTSNVSRTQMIESIGNFQDKLKLNQVAKNAARLGQPFSASSPFQFKSPINVEIIEDRFDPSGKAYTDGIGCISEDLIQEIRKSHELPFESAIQVRYHGAKGVLVLNKKLPSRTIYLRKSMVKFDPSLQQSGYGNELSIIEYNKFRGGYLNRQLIILLSTLGVPDQVFIDLQNEYIKSIEHVLAIDSSIYKHINVDYDQEMQGIPNIANLLREMINAGFNDKNNLFVQNVFDRLKERGLLQLRTKCNILVEKAARLLGVIDEYDLLQEDEVFSIYSPQPNDRPQVVTSETGYVIVSRNPCLHPGDIRKLAIVSDEEIKRRNYGVNPYFPDMVNCVIFPTKGLAITAQCGGGDLDGDQYFISWDDRLMIEQNCEPMVYDEDNKKKKQKLVEERGEFTEQYFDVDAMLDFLFQYLDSDVLGKIDNSHLAIADKSSQKANDEKCKKLAVLHAKAVDYVKHGEKVIVPPSLMAKEWPDFMEKQNKIIQYESESVLGRLYRDVKAITNKLNPLTQILQLGYKNPNLSPIDSELIYKYTPQSLKFQEILNVSDDQSMIQLDKSDALDENQKSYINQMNQKELHIEEIQKFIKEVFNEKVIEIAVKCLNYIFEQMDSLRKMYDIKNEYEIYSGYYTNFTKGEGTRLKRKLNIDNIQKQVLQYIVILKKRVNQKIDELKAERLAIISLMHFILSYSPVSYQNNNLYKGQFIKQLIEEIQQCQSLQFQRLQIKFSTWYRGCTWFLFYDELLQIKKMKYENVEKAQFEQVQPKYTNEIEEL